MSDWWLKFGCFLTGYKYAIIKQSSVASAKTVMKYTSAIMLVSLVWGFVGFYFTQRYLHGGFTGSIIGAILLVFVVVQIERQIILTHGKNLKIIRFRIALAVVMAVIGSIIIDQVIFAQDIETSKEETLSDKVNEEFPKRTLQLNLLIRSQDSTIKAKEKERDSIATVVNTNPTVPRQNISTNYKIDSNGRREIESQSVQQTNIPNPAGNRLPSMDTLILRLYSEKVQKEKELLDADNILRAEIRKRQGFFEELVTLFNLIFSSIWLVLVWLLFFAFFFSIELLVVFSKRWDSHTDYEEMITHQMNIRIDQLKALRNEQTTSGS